MAVVLCIVLTLAFKAAANEIYVGEPLAEALYDLAKDSVLVAHPLSGGTQLRRTDVFRLRDGRYVAITSRAQKTNEPFALETIQVAATDPDILTIKTPTVQSLTVSQAMQSKAPQIGQPTREPK